MKCKLCNEPIEKNTPEADVKQYGLAEYVHLIEHEDGDTLDSQHNAVPLEDRTLVFKNPLTGTQVLVTIYAEGEVDVAMRPADGDVWGPPWQQVSDERTSR